MSALKKSNSSNGGRLLALAFPIAILGCVSPGPSESRHELIESEVVRANAGAGPIAQHVEEQSEFYYSDIVSVEAIEKEAVRAERRDASRSQEDFGSIQSGGLSDEIKVGDEPVDSQTESKNILSFEDALTQVWQFHPKVIQALTELEATDFDLKGAKSGYYPYATLTSVEASNNASRTEISLVQPIWNGGLTSSQVKEAKAQQKLAIANLNQVRLDLAVQTAEAYLNVMLAEEQGRLWGRYMTSLEGLLSIITNRAEKGASPEVDIQTAVTRLGQAKAGFAASKSVLLANRLKLSSLLQVRFDKLRWPDEKYRLSEDEVAQARRVSNFSAHPIGQSALAEIELQRARVGVAKANLFPTLSLQYSNQIDQSEGDFTPDSSTQLVLQYDTSSGYRGVTGYQAVEHRLHGAFQDLSFARRDIGDIISTAYAERKVALQQYQAQVESAESAVLLVDSFLRQFKVGRKQWLEVLNAHREAHEALLQISSIKRNYWAANMRLALNGMVWGRLSAMVPTTYIPFEELNRD